MNRLLIALLALLPSAAAAQSLPSAESVRPVADSLAKAFLAQRSAPSVVIGVVRGTDTIAMTAFGTADLEHDVPATVETVYRIGSVTKQFTAAAVMQLAEQQKLRLDDTVAAFIPDLPAAWRPVTIRQLLNHTSGIPSYTSAGPRWQRLWGIEMPPESLLAITAADTMWFVPGSSWLYDNTGYILLGMVIEKVTGQAWEADLQTRLARPLGLTHTGYCPAETIIPHRARGYEHGDSGWINTPYLAMSQPWSAGALCSTVGDMVAWNRALHTGKVVSAESYRAMTTPEGAAAEGGHSYGFGLQQDSIGRYEVIEHGGGIHGFITANAWIPGPELSVTVLTNSGSARAGELLNQLARAALGLPLSDAPRPVPLAESERARYVGVYALELPPGPRDFTVAAADGGGLTAQLVGQGPIPLIYYGEHTFGAEFDPSVRLIFAIEGGRATEVTLLQGGARFQGMRK